eukprot:1338001-Prymnesium_polylepis.1
MLVWDEKNPTATRAREDPRPARRRGAGGGHASNAMWGGAARERAETSDVRRHLSAQQQHTAINPVYVVVARDFWQPNPVACEDKPSCLQCAVVRTTVCLLSPVACPCRVRSSELLLFRVPPS